MNLKYYLRGLGTGVIVTALIMGIAVGGKKETLSDSEIKERASALGMIEESTLLSDTSTSASKSDEEELPEATVEALGPAGSEENLDQETTAAPTTDPTPAATVEPTLEPTPSEEPEVTPESEVTQEPTSEPESEAIPEESEEDVQSVETITIQINSGDGSFTACRQLEEAGLIESASSFDRYLYENGYDKRINVGTFEVPVDAEPEQIARILAGLE